MRAASRPKPIGKAPEVHLIDRVEHLDDGPLDNLVFQRGDTERALPPVRLRDIHSPRRFPPVTPCMQPLVQVAKVSLQSLPIGPPCNTVNPRRSPRADRPKR